MIQYIKEVSKSGYATYKCNNLYIYSKYDPIKEAKRFIDTQQFKKNVITLCGTDYVNMQLSEISKVEKIISIEPIDFDNKDIPKKIRFNNITKLEEYLWEAVENREIDITEVSLLFWLPLINSNPDFFLPIVNKIGSIVKKITLSYNTEKYFINLEYRNIIRNSISLSEIEILPYQRMNDEIALIIASGPSLYENLPKIERLKDRIKIFSLPSALPYLYHKKIYPDYAIAVDPGYATFYHISKYKKDIKLLTTLCINPAILRLNNIVPIFFNYGSSIEKAIFKDTDILTSQSEGSVIFNLINILEKTGFKKVIVIGLDFCFKNNRSHIKEGYFEKEFLATTSYFKTLDYSLLSIMYKKDKTTIKIEDKIFETDISLKTYYEHFIQKKFNLEIILFNDCYNPLSNDIKKIDFSIFEKSIKLKTKNDFITNKFYFSNNIKNIISTDLLSNTRVELNKINYKKFDLRLPESM